jgi:hypothetical protein
MTILNEYFEFNCSFDYRQLKETRKELLSSPIFYCPISNTRWRLHVERSDSSILGIYLTLIDGAPCNLHSYTLSMITNAKPQLTIFNNKCTLQRAFSLNDISWGFENFCTRRDLKDERRLICDPKTKLVKVRCTMNIEVSIPDIIINDHRLATDLFHKYSLQQWIKLIKQTNDLPELTNRVNEQIEANQNIK